VLTGTYILANTLIRTTLLGSLIIAGNFLRQIMLRAAFLLVLILVISNLAGMHKNNN
jgi:hypothetical protein